MTEERKSEIEWALIQASIVRLRASVMALTFGLVGGAGLFVATIWLVIRGGLVVGPNLSLLQNYFPGYSVSLGGSLIGFAYGALCGAAIGWSTALIYNKIAKRRAPGGPARGSRA